jgi:hypothetical protein
MFEKLVVSESQLECRCEWVKVCNVSVQNSISLSEISLDFWFTIKVNEGGEVCTRTNQQ